MRNINYMLLVLAVVILGSCSPTTKLTASWAMQDGEPKKYKNLAVIVLAKVPANREISERAIAMELRSRGIKAIGTTGIFPFADKQDELKDMGIEVTPEIIKAKLKEKVISNDIDALMMVTVLDKQKETEQRGGNFGVSMGYPITSYPYVGYTPWDYYHYSYSTVYSPTYYVTTTTYLVETNIYDVATENLIWSGATETTDPKTVHEEAASFATIIADQIVLDGVLK